MMFDTILVVCTGNICRSPFAAQCLRQYLPGKIIDSAGVQTREGLRADRRARGMAAQYGLSLEAHRSRAFTPALGHRYALILVMEREHLTWIDRILPEARGKTLLFGHGISPEAIPDPYGRGDAVFQRVFRQIELACGYWAVTLDDQNDRGRGCQQ